MKDLVQGGAVEDPDALWSSEASRGGLINELVRMNLMLYNLHDEDPWIWMY